jgi:hypothetical protein
MVGWEHVQASTDLAGLGKGTRPGLRAPPPSVSKQPHSVRVLALSKLPAEL